MMTKRITGICLMPLVLMVSGLATAATDTQNAIRQSLGQVMPDFTPSEIRPSPVEGLSEVLIGPKLFYMTNDGKYLFQGSLIDIKTRTDISEQRRKVVRLEAVDNVGEDNMIIFPAKDERHKITVFTDVDCGYCRKLHKEIDKYNNKGITVRYLMFPRSGKDTPSYYKAVSVWCSDDRREALTRAKAGETLPRAECSNPVNSHMDLGKLLGIQGTPAIVLDDGELVPGYVPPNRLAQVLDSSR
ncbi:MAG: bifunctional protein-disulfide isomerase/oxidoreductase DsbC [Gammaproteobacteria bacterium]|jgi:thiol:disulfide interchange protein DsbC